MTPAQCKAVARVLGCVSVERAFPDDWRIRFPPMDVEAWSDADLFHALLLKLADMGLYPSIRQVHGEPQWECDLQEWADGVVEYADTPLAALVAAVEAMENADGH